MNINKQHDLPLFIYNKLSLNVEALCEKLRMLLN